MSREKDLSKVLHLYRLNQDAPKLYNDEVTELPNFGNILSPDYFVIFNYNNQWSRSEKLLIFHKHLGLR